MTLKDIPRGRPLTADERAAFLGRHADEYEAFIRRLRDECDAYPELMVPYGFAAVQHPPTVGLLAYRHDEMRHEAARAIRQQNADRAMGKMIQEQGT